MIERQSRTRFPAIRQYDTPSWLITILGVILGIGGITHVYTNPEPMFAWFLEFAVLGVMVALILYGGYWMATKPLNRSDRWSIAIWSLVGGAVIGVIVVGYIVTEQMAGDTIVEPRELLIFGLLAGSVVSLYTSMINERRQLSDTVEMGTQSQFVEMPNEHLSDDARTFATLCLDTRSWNLLQFLFLADNPVTIETLVSQLAAVENAEVETILKDVIHIRLPRLENQGLIRYTVDGKVTYSPDRITEMANSCDELSASGAHLVAMVE